MRNLGVLGLLIYKLLTSYYVSAQSVFNNGSLILNNSDNTGSIYQPGTEVLNSIPGMGIIFEAGSTFEHVGQFYVAEDGIWNYGDTESTDYFGYSPTAAGSTLPYQGIGIKGASANNGGQGAGRPTFNNLELNSTGIFPVVAGMYITKSLAFNANGPNGSNIITTPTISIPDSPANSVVFAPTAAITGANSANYINGYASVTNVVSPFTLPLGDPLSIDNPLHPLTINGTIDGTVTARYLHIPRHSVTYLGTGISWVSPIGSWPLSALSGTDISVDLPALPLSADDAAYLRLVGWNGREWINLSDAATPGACVVGNCPLTGRLTGHVTDLAIGLSRLPANAARLTTWPNPTKGTLHFMISVDKTINKLQILDQQGRFVLTPSKIEASAGLDVSVLPVGSYILEVHTDEGEVFRQRFIRQ